MLNKIKFNKFIKFVIPITIFIIFNISNEINLFASPKKSKHKSTIHKVTKIKKQSNNLKLLNKKTLIKKNTITQSFLKLENYSELSEGIFYRVYSRQTKKTKQLIHVVEANFSETNCKINILKSGGNIFELEKLYSLVQEYDSTNQNKVIAAVNGNFWKAVSNIPIGPLVINGEVAQLNTHKRWSSAFFTAENKMYIDNFYIDGIIKSKKFADQEIISVNRRIDTCGIVLYNIYGGEVIPYIQEKKSSEIIEDYLSDMVYDDSTEAPLDTFKLKHELLASRRAAFIEFKMPKILLRKPSNCSLNSEIPCIVEGKLDSGEVKTDSNHYILSYSCSANGINSLKKGDTVIISFNTNKYQDIKFINAVSGTPRLVRSGKAQNEANFEGSHGRRFINRALPRCAIGTNKQKDRIYFVTVEPGGRRGRSWLASLQQMSQIMQKIGAYDAMNLDGGGSTSMVIGGKNVVLRNRPDSGRRVAVGLAITKKK